MKKCQVFSPKELVRQLLDEAEYKKNLYNKKILENSCGNGNILEEIVIRYINDCERKGYKKSKIESGLQNDIYGFEIDADKHKECIDRLNLIIIDKGYSKIKWSIYNLDFLKYKFDLKFDYIVGNPPYISYKDMNSKSRKFLKANFSTCSKGKFDYCFAFIEKSLNIMSDIGKLSYIIPNSIFRINSAQILRNLMLSYMIKIIDFKDKDIFKGQAFVKSSIIVLNKNSNKNKISYANVLSDKKLLFDKAKMKEKWFLSGEINTGIKRFGDDFKACYPIATLLNKVFILPDCQLKKNKYMCNDIILERNLLYKAVSIKSLKLNRNEMIIFPYKVSNNKITHFSYVEFKMKYPLINKYLEKNKNKLLSRKIDKNSQWFEYGRTQSLNCINIEKLMVSNIITKSINVYKVKKNEIAYSGIIVMSKKSDKDLEKAKRILMSKRFLDYAYSIGNPISGKSILITSKDIENYMYRE